MVGVAYDTDPRKALSAIGEVLQKNPRMLKDPAPVVAVSILAQPSISNAVKPWSNVPDYVAAGGEIAGAKAIPEALPIAFRSFPIEG